jgi:aspartate aminotransferase
VLEPHGGIYLCLEAGAVLAATGMTAADDVALADLVAHHAGVKTRPGSTFGLPDHLRLCVAGPSDEIVEVAARLSAFVERLRPHLGEATATAGGR